MFGVILQIVILDMIFSCDSILKAFGTTDHLLIKIITIRIMAQAPGWCNKQIYQK